jgi:general secretion pathway protein B
MSYILDALKRSEAERNRGAVPGLHSPQVSGPLPHTDRALSSRGWWFGAAALVLTVFAVGLWAWRTPSTDAVVAVLPTASATYRPSPAALASAPSPQQATPAARPSSSTVPTQPAAPARETTRTPAAKAVPVKAAPSQAAPSQAVPVSAPLLSELPEDLRRQIPALNITGVVYSENPGQRLLLVNNQVLTQGSAVAPELSLDEIQPRSSVLSFRGTRFRVGH